MIPLELQMSSGTDGWSSSAIENELLMEPGTMTSRHLSLARSTAKTSFQLAFSVNSKLTPFPPPGGHLAAASAAAAAA